MPTKSSPRTEPKRAPGRALLSIALTGLVVGLLFAALLTLSSTAANNADVASCAARRIEVSISSSERSPAMQKLAVNVMSEMALSAAVCAEHGEVVAVAGGGQVLPLLTQDDIARYTPEGPNRAVREARLDPSAKSDLTRLASRRLSEAYRNAGGTDVSSVAPLYADAAQHAGRGTDVIMVLDGVNHDAQIDLNRPLNAGDGARLARLVHIEPVNNHVTTLVGVAQIDTSTPPPGPSWAAEVLSFNKVACIRSQANRCRLFAAASVQEVLNT